MNPIEALKKIAADPTTPASIRQIAQRGLDGVVRIDCPRPAIVDMATITPNQLIQHWQEHHPHGQIPAE